MKVAVVLICTLALICHTLSAPSPREDNEFVLERAQPCDPQACRAPECRCSSTILDPQIPISQTPQLVMLTFDDAVTAANYKYIEQAINGRVNPDGCPAAATFFVSHEYTDYSKVHALWSEGHEIALHSISHQPTVSYWKGASVDTLLQEFRDERDLIAHFAQIDQEDIKGVRVPLFQLSGNNTFEMMKKAGLVYDCSWPSQHFTDPGMWPYSLDYSTTQDCTLGDCPSASIPGVWVAPILSWTDIEGYHCSMVDACQYLPEDDEEQMFQWMKSNFERHYKGNRAPFGVFLHAAWFWTRESHFPAYQRFVAYMNSLPDVYLVSVSEAVEYTRNPRAIQPEAGVREPQPLENPEPEIEENVDVVEDIEEDHEEVEKRSISGRQTQIRDTCQRVREPTCHAQLCQLKKELTGEERWMTSCTNCPEVYPWLGNPLGVADRKKRMG